MNFFGSNTHLKEARDERDRLVKQKIYNLLREQIEIIILQADESNNGM